MMGPVLPPLPTNKPKAKMKQFHWVQIPKTKVSTSIFMKGNIAKNTGNVIKDISLDEIEEMFSQKTSNAPVGGGSSGEVKPQVISLVDPKKSQNAALILGSMRLELSDIKRAILSLDEKFPLQNVKALTTIAPSSEETDAVTGYDGDVKMLALADRFFREIADIPRIDKRLNCWMFKKNFLTKIGEIKPGLESALEAANEVQNSKPFLHMLEIILTIGNFLNAGSAKGNTYGFKLETLLKLNDTRSSDNKTTLLQFIAQHIENKEPETLGYAETLAHVEAASKVVVSVMQSEIADVRKGIKEIEGEIEQSRDSQLAGDRFVEVMGEFKNMAIAEFETLNARFEELNKAVVAMAECFGEDPKNIKPEEFFALINNFNKMFEAAHKMNVQKREADAKQKAKEAAENARKAAKTKAAEEKKAEVTSGTLDDMASNLRDGTALRSKRESRAVTANELKSLDAAMILARRTKK